MNLDNSISMIECERLSIDLRISNFDTLDSNSFVNFNSLNAIIMKINYFNKQDF